MSLIVTLSTYEGIVFACDDLVTTSFPNSTLSYVTRNVCPHCNFEYDEAHEIDVPSDAYHIRGRYEKIIPLFNRFGVGFVGCVTVGDRSIIAVAKEVEFNLLTTHQNIQTEPLDTVARIFCEKLQEIRLELGFNEAARAQFVGYDFPSYDKPKMIEYELSDQMQLIVNTTDITGRLIGDYEHIEEILNVTAREPYLLRSTFQSFSLANSVKYAEFIIKTASSFQQFSVQVPSIGSDVHIATITPFEGFKWCTKGGA